MEELSLLQHLVNNNYCGRNVDVFALDGDGNTLLHIVAGLAGKKKRKVQRFLGSNGYDIVSVVQALIDNGVDVNAQNNTGDTALLMAVSVGNTDVAWNLIDNGADVRIYSNDNWAVLHCVASREYSDSMQKLAQKLIDVNADMDYQNDFRNTPLHLAVLFKNQGFAQKLIDSGANVNIRNSKGNTPLELASKHNMLLTTVKQQQ